MNFEGFKPELFDFLVELKFNNNKTWFDENRQRYKQLFKEPMDLLAQDLAKGLKEQNKNMDIVYSVSRINRDVRFSKNKEPYRTSKWISFRQEKGNWSEKPVLYFEITPECYYYGMGIYCATPTMMSNYRKRIDSNNNEILRLIKKYNSQNTFLLEAESYKKKKGNYEGDLAKWYQLKDFNLIAQKSINDTIFDGSVEKEILDGFKFLMPFYKYFDEIEKI